MQPRLSFLVFIFIRTLAGAEFQFQSGPEQVPLVELYTSEGCSSCPRADAWMSGLRTHQDLWKGFVPVVFHVDYWDRLGWKDRFARRTFSQRQYDYAQIWSNESVYTPGVVLGGMEWQGWRGAERPTARKTPAHRHSERGKQPHEDFDRHVHPCHSEASNAHRPCCVARF